MIQACRVWTVVLAVGLSLAGCGGAKLNNLDAEFQSLYLTKAEGLKAGDALSAAASDLGLVDLSARAKQAGTDAQNKDWRTAVAFYRIAALAAWQAGERGGQLILEITDAGAELCQNRTDQAPRDCLLMIIIGPLAVHDDLARDLEPVQAKSTKEIVLGAEDLATLESVFDGVETQFGKISNAGEAARATPAPKSLLEYIDKQRLILFCTAQAARDLMLDASEVGGRTALDRRRTRYDGMLSTVKAALGHADCPTS